MISWIHLTQSSCWQRWPRLASQCRACRQWMSWGQCPGSQTPTEDMSLYFGLKMVKVGSRKYAPCKWPGSWDFSSQTEVRQIISHRPGLARFSYLLLSSKFLHVHTKSPEVLTPLLGLSKPKSDPGTWLPEHFSVQMWFNFSNCPIISRHLL